MIAEEKKRSMQAELDKAPCLNCGYSSRVVNQHGHVVCLVCVMSNRESALSGIAGWIHGKWLQWRTPADA